MPRALLNFEQTQLESSLIYRHLHTPDISIGRQPAPAPHSSQVRHLSPNGTPKRLTRGAFLIDRSMEHCFRLSPIGDVIDRIRLVHQFRNQRDL